MQNIFNYENGIMRTINKVADGVTLGVLWAICSIPVVTIGASSAAFYYAYNRCIRQNMDYAWKTFFACFKANFKQATRIWLIVLGLSFIAALDCYLLSLMNVAAILVTVLQAAMIAVLLVSIIWGIYLFPYLSRFDNPTKTVMKNCALIALANMPQSILLLVLFALSTVGFLCLPLLNLFIPSLYMFFTNRILEAVFRKYMLPEDLSAEMRLEENSLSE